MGCAWDWSLAPLREVVCGQAWGVRLPQSAPLRTGYPGGYGTIPAWEAIRSHARGALVDYLCHSFALSKNQGEFRVNRREMATVMSFYD